MDAREHVDRHGQYALARNWQALGADFTPEALEEATKLGLRPPRGTTQYRLIGEQQDGEDYTFDVEYSGGEETKTIRSTWRKQGEDWKIVRANYV